ncbi:MAG: 2-oxoacid:acceptor oxidoreductase subunit alpha [Pseudomonadota bacterium]
MKATGSPSYRYLMGNIACAEAAINAGCRFYGGYPITPSSEIMERMAVRLDQVGGRFIQMEDEIASICAVIGASWAGLKAMTATSGPGFSLMQEAIGYAAWTETPCVIIDIQRAGPCTGQATKVGSGDIMQARYGSHGDYTPIALSPWSAQELYDMTIKAFNLAERFRVPALVMSDEAVGHLRENVRLHEDFDVVSRKKKPGSAPFGTDDPDGVPPMPSFGEGENLMVTGSTHDQWGFRKVDHPDTHARLVERINRKIENGREDIIEVETGFMDDARVAVLAYGFTARSAVAAVKSARKRGGKAGFVRLKTLWPFPDREIESCLGGVEKVFVPEMNRGQVAMMVRGCCGAEVIHYGQTDGRVIELETIEQELGKLI